MKKRNLAFSPSEQEVLETMWEEGRPLSKNELISLSANKTWKDSYVHIILNSLLKKNAIKEAGKVQLSNRYSRLFAPLLTEEQFAIIQLNSNPGAKAAPKSFLFAALLEDTKDEELIEELEEMLRKKRRELEEEKEAKE